MGNTMGTQRTEDPSLIRMIRCKYLKENDEYETRRELKLQRNFTKAEKGGSDYCKSSQL